MKITIEVDTIDEAENLIKRLEANRVHVCKSKTLYKTNERILLETLDNDWKTTNEINTKIQSKWKVSNRNLKRRLSSLADKGVIACKKATENGLLLVWRKI